MLITIPASAHGTQATASVLDLEPLLSYCRQCRPDAVSLLPPTGPDDLPNGAALLAMKGRLEAEGLRVVAGAWEVPASAPVGDAGWQTESLFEARAVVGALGEAGVAPLTVDWRPRVRSSAARTAMYHFLERLTEEADRARVRIAFQPSFPLADADGVVREFESEYLGVGLDLRDAGVRAVESARAGLSSAGERLFAVEGGRCGLGDGKTADAWRGLVKRLREMRFSGPVHVSGLSSPVEFGCAVGFLRGLCAG
jgi:sugar phosphate isomerase/epimerase